MGDSNALRDSVTVETNGSPSDSDGDNLEPIGERPAKGAPAAEWAAYAVSLGADLAATADQSRADLFDLADRLGG